MTGGAAGAPSVSAPALALRGISKHFGATVALDGVQFDLERGDIHALLGENGAGKSTLMRIIAGAVRADAGRMELFGRAYAPRDCRAARAESIAMIHQEPALAPHLTVAENLLLGVEPRARGFLGVPFVDRRAATARARRALEGIGRADIDAQRRVGELAPAERQLVEIARALAIDCGVLILDEPTSSLGRDDVQRLFALLRRLRDSGLAIIYISHFLEEVREICNRFTVLRDGRVAGSGSVAATPDRELVHLLTGRALPERGSRTSREPGETLIDIAGMSGREAPVEASLVLRRGEVLGIAGLVGSGRSELLRCIFGLEPIRSGRLRVAGDDSLRPSPPRRWGGGVGMVGEDRARDGLLPARSVAENVTLTRLRSAGRGPFVSATTAARSARRWIDELAIRCRDAHQPVATLSGGNQQKVLLARLLHHECDVMLLDEPTRGIDLGAKATIASAIDAIASGCDGRAAAGVLLVSSDPQELLGLCDRIAVMRRGEVGPARPVSEWTEHGLLLEAMGGEQ